MTFFKKMRERSELHVGLHFFKRLLKITFDYFE